MTCTCGGNMTVAKVETSVPSCLVTLERDYMGNWKQTRRMTGKQTVALCDRCERVEEIK